MNEQQTMLADTAGPLFAELGPGARVATDWAKVEELGFAGLLLREADGGFGGSWEDANIVFRLAGYHALTLPLVEGVIAARIATDAGYRVAGIGTLAEAGEGRLECGRFTGVLRGVPWGRDAAFVAAPAFSGGAMLLSTQGARIEQHASIAGEPRDVLHIEDVEVILSQHDVYALGAAARVMQMSGALDAALSLAVRYVNDRKQFGKPLGKLQAVQQALAVFACEAAATNCAATEVARGLDRGDASFEIAAAKLRANMAAGQGTSVAHQVHGAIGFTEEYALHPLTRRLWSWRSEFGGESHWSLELGARVARAGAEAFWPDMVRRSDPVPAG